MYLKLCCAPLRLCSEPCWSSAYPVFHDLLVEQQHACNWYGTLTYAESSCSEAQSVDKFSECGGYCWKLFGFHSEYDDEAQLSSLQYSTLLPVKGSFSSPLSPMTCSVWSFALGPISLSLFLNVCKVSWERFVMNWHFKPNWIELVSLMRSY